VTRSISDAISFVSLVATGAPHTKRAPQWGRSSKPEIACYAVGFYGIEYLLGLGFGFAGLGLQDVFGLAKPSLHLGWRLIEQPAEVRV